MQQHRVAEPTCRIDGIIANEANKVVIFRRGPSKIVQQLVWDLNDDTITPGQWLKARVYTKRCDVSSDGKYLVIHATNYSARYSRHQEFCQDDPGMLNGWTAISRPPYFTAIALWFTGDAWNGGGIWQNDQYLKLNRGPGTWREERSPSAAIKVRDLKLGGSEDEPIFTMRLKSRGWITRRREVTRVTNPDWKSAAKALYATFMEPPTSLDEIDGWLKSMEAAIPKWHTDVSGIMEKPFPKGVLERESSIIGDIWRLKDVSARIHKEWKLQSFGTMLIDVDASGRPIFSEEGCLWAWAGFPDGEPTLVADLNVNTFESVPPPDWAREW